MNKLVTDLQKQANNLRPPNRLVKKFYKLCYELNWTLPDTGKLDYARIENWLNKYSYLHKQIDEYTEGELPCLVSQLQTIANENKNEKKMK